MLSPTQLLNISMVLVALLLFSSILFAQDNFQKDRIKMVRKQIEDRGIKNPMVLEAMRCVKRHLFVPARYRAKAYRDQALPIGKGQTISQPYIVAHTIDVLNLKKEHKVLEVGTGSGYLAAVLAEIVDSVVTIEIVESLGKKAAVLLDSLNYKNVKVVIGDGFFGYEKSAPYDAIIVSAGAPEVPVELIRQLKSGGQLIMPIGAHHGVQTLTLVTKNKDKLVTEELTPVRFVPLTRNDD